VALTYHHNSTASSCKADVWIALLLPLGYTISYQHTRQDVPKLSLFVDDHEKQRDWLRLAFYRDCHRASAIRIYRIGTGIKNARPYISAV
jgi:hypothetical protein